ncbi:MAG: 6,7-dimethyl-8-ribityllumazine synthase [Proteobacteria bacterium]|nr:6,7-dimethyl-8-ribityllumazine synthase [Pseudomonadota bacterium]
MTDKPHIMVVEARFYEDLSDALWEGARAALETAGATYERVAVPGALEIPTAMRIAHLANPKKFDGYVALGCVIRGETTHYDTVCNESARGLMSLGTEYGLCIGNGILTCENDEQAWVRAKANELDKGGGAALAALSLINLRKKLGA